MAGLIEKITLSEKSASSFDYKKAFDDCFVDLSEELAPPPVVLGIGYHEYKNVNYLNPTFTVGEMSAIIAPQKTKKTFFKTAVAASYIGGNSSDYFPMMVSCRESDKYVLDFDTEQGKYYAQRAFRRVAEMVGNNYPNYLAFGMKKLSDEDRVSLIDGVMNDPKYKGNIGMVFITYKRSLNQQYF